MWPHFEGMVQIVSSIDTFKVKPGAANGLIKGVADIICIMGHNEIQGAVRFVKDMLLNFSQRIRGAKIIMLAHVLGLYVGYKQNR